MLNRQDDDQNNQRQTQVFKRTEVNRAVTAAESINANTNKAQANGKHNGTRDDRREESAKRL